MDWWVIELITNIVLVALAVGLGPFIKRFGRSYAADVFRANLRRAERKFERGSVQLSLFQDTSRLAH